MFVITKKTEHGNLFYRFSSDEKDLYCVATDTIETCKKYNAEEKKRLEQSELLSLRKVMFKEVKMSL